MTMRTLGRRTFLRGLGVSMALPWLESRSVWGAARGDAGESVMQTTVAPRSRAKRASDAAASV